MADDSPLTEEDFLELQRQLANLNRADREIEKASRAGIDVTQQRAQAKEMREKLLQVKQAYFPGR